MKPPRMQRPNRELVRLLRQDSFGLKDSPSITTCISSYPTTSTIIPRPENLSITNLKNLIFLFTQTLTTPTYAEAEHNLAVTSLIQIQSQTQSGWGVWTDVVADERVTYMENLIANHYPFRSIFGPEETVTPPGEAHSKASAIDEECHRRELVKCPSIPALALGSTPTLGSQARLLSLIFKYEVSMVEAKVLDLAHFQSLKSVTEQIDSHKTWQELEVEMMSKLNEHMSEGGPIYG
ncbi:hypothetical protein Bca52824_011986 [Brassica carinata]|uniref:Uncharacterized protein n=1 Tax=Brassica carinata TaxID=52824 RepID=A0A8X8B1Y5_BRACI|nr:hypothetical protein Bca52824_011986 [Brassica carinata]